MPHFRSLGREAEDAAAEFRASQGYTLLKRRFKAGAGEIDLIALDREVLAFIEVKQRRVDDPLDSVDLAKQLRIASAAGVYLARWDGPPCEVRYDVVAIGPSGMTLHRDAFRPR